MTDIVSLIYTQKRSIYSPKRKAQSPLKLTGLFDENINIIAEVKFASPTEGIIRDDLLPLHVAKLYKDAGAKAFSVLTEETYFKGSLDYIRQIKEVFVDTPVLMKDFIIDTSQIREGYIAGADSFLLISDFLKMDELKLLYDYGKSLGMTALVEVHSERALEQALIINPEIIGINNRDLSTLKINLDTTNKLRTLIPKGIKVISESGFSRKEELSKVTVDGFLIGSSLMKEEDPGVKLQELLK